MLLALYRKDVGGLFIPCLCSQQYCEYVMECGSCCLHTYMTCLLHSTLGIIIPILSTVKMLRLAGERQPQRFWIITCTTIWLCYCYYGVFFAHILILEYLDHHQNLISSLLYYPGPLHKISSQSIHNFLSNVVHKQTNKQTDKPTLPKNNLLYQGGNYALSPCSRQVITVNSDSMSD